jgi:hypothetical protein
LKSESIGILKTAFKSGDLIQYAIPKDGGEHKNPMVI